MSKRILITPRSLTQHHSPDLQALENAGYELVYVRPGITPTEEELLELVPDCVGWLAGVEPISERVLRAATNLKVISRNGTGIDNIPLNLAQELRIKVLRVEAANARGVAELTICLALAALRHLPALHCAVKQGKWKLIRGSEIQGRLLGLVGCGAVGKIVARLALRLDARVAAFDLFPDRSFEPGENFSWTDVFQTEPPDPASPLLRHQRVIVSPHIGAYTYESIQRATRKAVENILSAFDS